MTRSQFSGGLLLTITLLIAACTNPSTQTPPPRIPGAPPAPSGYRLEHAGPGLSPRLGRLLDKPRTTPLTATLAVYVAESGDTAEAQGDAAQRAITLTLATYADRSGTLAAYNAWFAEIGFMPAAERVPLDLGEQAERFDVGWPPLHAVIARAGPHFVIAEAGEGVPADRRGAILEELVRSALALP